MRLPVALMMYCGLDPQDTLELPRTSIKDGFVDSRRGETNEPVWLPLPVGVAEALAAAPTHGAITFCASTKGEIWSQIGFSTAWRRVRLKLEAEGAVLSGLTLKGLRHTVATILAESGHDKRAIADLLGQKTEAMAAHYSRRADLTKRNTATIVSLDAEVNRCRPKSVKPA